MTGFEISNLLAQRESDHLEFKESFSPTSVARTAAAFLNSGGGTLVVGIRERGGAPEVVGVPDAARIAERVERALNEAILPTAPIAVSVLEVDDGRNVVVVDVPAAAEPPYVYRNQVYVRRGTATQPATARDVLELVDRRRQEPPRWERQPAPGVEISDLSVDEIARTAQEARERRLVELGTEPDDVLEALSLVSRGRMCNGAVVLFGRDPARIYPQTQVHVAHFRSERRDEIEDSRTLRGNAFELVERLWDFVTAHMPIRSSLNRGHQREDRPAYPVGALREALMNAIVHRDYAAYSGSVSVTMYSDRIEVWNPGRLPEGIHTSELKRGTVSRPHNPDIAHVFYLRGLVERLGIGTRRIADECREAGLPEPQWEEVSGGIRLTISLGAKAGAAPTDLNERALAYLRDVATGVSISAADYHARYAPDRTERTARADLAALVDLGLTRRVGRGPGTRYVRTERPGPNIPL